CFPIDFPRSRPRRYYLGLKRPRRSWWAIRLLRLSSGSYCSRPTMWCLLLAVWPCLERCCTQNEESLSHPRIADSGTAELCAVPGAGRGSDRTDHGGCAADFLLSRAFGVDGVSAVLH